MTVDKGDWNFFDFKAMSNSCIFHADLKGVTFEWYAIQWNLREHLMVVTFKACGGVFDVDQENEAHINAGKIAHQDAF